jgi:hypothetical protein
LSLFDLGLGEREQLEESQSTMENRRGPSLLMIFVILAVALAVFFTLLKGWPYLAALAASRSERGNPNATVWVNQHSGLYYCSGSSSFGKVKPGQYLIQAEALEKGYRPTQGNPCR